MNRKKVILTNNKEIYDKLISLNFNNEIVLRNCRFDNQIGKILRNINSERKVLDAELVGDYLVIKKILPINYNVYLK